MIVRLALILAAIAATLLILLLTPAEQPILGFTHNEFARTASAFITCGAIVAYFFTHRLPAQKPKGRRKRNITGEVVTAATAWMIIVSVAVLTYTYRYEAKAIAERVAAEFLPGTVMEGPAGEAIVSKRQNGHFVVDARVNGARAAFLFDTGASSMVIRAEDADKLGIDFGTLNFAIPVATANGNAMAAETMLSRVTVGKIAVKNVRALVTKPGVLTENLLGMSFLEKLASYTVESNKLILRAK